MVIGRKTKVILLHIIVWCVYIMFPLAVVALPDKLFDHNGLQIKIYILLSILSIGFYYFNYHWSIPRLFLKHRYVYFTFVSMAALFISYAIVRLSVYFFILDPIPIDNELLLLNRTFFFRFLSVFIVSFGISFYNRYRQVESEKIKTELALLRHQVNPHFLFNILNDIYGQAITKSSDTADSISRLSELMRYVLTEAKFEKVPLEKEINYLKNYIALQEMRLTDKTRVDVQFVGDFTNKQIPPLLFINFIENAFKYGTSTEIETSITIRIEVINNLLELQAKNDKPLKNTLNQFNSSSIGIKNTIRRLDLIYNNKYKLDITNMPEYFLVNLSIDLT